jgi:hypothetical protein
MTKGKNHIKLRIGEVINGEIRPILLRQQPANFDGQKKNVYHFGEFEFMTSLFTFDKVEPGLKTVSIEYLHYKDPKDEENFTVVGQSRFLIKDAIQKGSSKEGGKFYIQNTERSKYIGSTKISLFNTRRFYSFFDLIFKNQLNIVPIIGMDFSMANLKMDDASVLHTLKPGVQNDYVEGMKGVYEAFDPFSHFFLTYGFGARTHSRGDKHDQDPCDCFAMSGDFCEPYAYTQEQLLS